MAEWEPLLWLLMFLTGWFVCWIQMSKSESRKVETLRSLNRWLLEKFQSPLSQSEYLTHLQLENQKLKSAILMEQSMCRILESRCQRLMEQSQFRTERSPSQDWDLQQG